MCTLLTVNRDTFLTDRHLFIARILKDAVYNCDGWNLVAVDPYTSSDINLSCMNVPVLIKIVESFMDSASEYGRIWIHSRAATTESVGIAYTHGFSNFHGVIIQHNGIISNYRKLSVDSHNLVDFTLSHANDLFDELHTYGECFANIFLIRPADKTYGVVRMASGTLFQDDEGNYSTNMVGGINKPVRCFSAYEHSIVPSVSNTKTYVPTEFNDPYDIIRLPEDTPPEDIGDFVWDAVTNKIKAG